MMLDVHSAVVEDGHDDVLLAYQQVLKKFKDTKSVAASDFLINEQSPQPMVAPEQINMEEMVARFASLKTALNMSLDAMQENYALHHQSCQEMEKQVDAVRAELHELHQIKVEHSTLSALIEAHHQKKQVCEKEYQAFFDQFEEEKKCKIQEWRNEEQRYRYERDLAREKERNLFEMEKRSLEQGLSARRFEFEREMKDRLLKIELQEGELANLERYKQALDRVPDEVRAQVAQAEALLTKQLHTQHYYEIQLLKKELELKEQMIATLEARITHFDALKTSFNQLMFEKMEKS